jgi:hypothetical protein
VRSSETMLFACLTAWLCAASGLTSGCATNLAAPHGKLGAGEWQMQMPLTYSPVAALTHDSAGAVPPVLDDVVVAAAMDELPLQAARPRARVRARSRLVAAAHPAADPTVASVSAARNDDNDLRTWPDVEAPSEDTQYRYAARQEQAHEQQSFRGGAVIIVGTVALLTVTVIAVLGLLYMMFRRDCW